MIIYQILPRLWGEGKMNSVDTSSLNYFKGLGVTHVWYTGIIRHSTGKPFVKGDPGSPYAISDYYDVNEYLAERKDERMSEFENLIKRTHDSGMKVIIDFVPNHIGLDYSDCRGGIPHFNWHDYDWTDTQKIDYSGMETWEAMLGILDFWAGKGVDGFRCDMVELVPPEFFRWLIARVKVKFPHVIFIAEVYQKERYREFIDNVGFDFLYDKSGLYDTVRAVVSGNGSAREISRNWQFLGDMQPQMLNFLENHDEQRIASRWFAGRADHFASLGVSLFLNTAPFMLYFGQEIGLDASEGHEGRTSIFNWSRPEGLQRLYAYIHGDGDLTGEESAVLDRYMYFLGIAGDESVTSGMTYDLCYCQDSSQGFNPDKHFIFLRRSRNKTILFCCNFSDSRAEMSVRIPHHAIHFLGLDPAKTGNEINISVPAFGLITVTL